MIEGYMVILNDGFLGRTSGFIQRLADAEVIAKKMANDEGGTYNVGLGPCEGREKIQRRLKETKEGDTIIIRTTMKVTIESNYDCHLFEFNLERK